MSIRVRLIGFGDDKPPGFDATGCKTVELDTPASIEDLLNRAAIEPAPDLIVMNTDSVIPRSDWRRCCIDNDAEITILSAIEGG